MNSPESKPQGSEQPIISMIRKYEHLGDGPWWLWEAERELHDGTIERGFIEGDGHLCAPETWEGDQL